MAVSERRKKIFWWLVYVLWVLLDVEGFWERSHLVCILLAVFGTVCVSFAEIDSLYGATGLSLASALIGTLVYISAPPTILPEIEVTETLEPGGEITPQNGCSREADAPTSTKVLIGDNAVSYGRPGHFIALKIAQCDVISVDAGDGNISISAKIFDEKGRLVAIVDKNTIHILTSDEIPMPDR